MHIVLCIQTFVTVFLMEFPYVLANLEWGNLFIRYFGNGITCLCIVLRITVMEKS